MNHDPSEGLIKEVLGSFLIPGYIAYEWKYQKNIPMVGIEDNAIYQLCTRLWVKMQAGQEDDRETAAIWHFTVVARNKNIANTLIEKTRTFENPILFVGGLHLRKQDSDDFQQFKNGGFGSALSPEETAYLGKGENSGIYDYLGQEKIGYTFNGDGNNFDPEHHEDQRDNDWHYHWDNEPHDSRGGKPHWDRGNLHDGGQEWSPDGQNWYPK